MLYWKDRRNIETGSHAEVWDWRSVLCNVARLSRMSELPDSGYLDRFRKVGGTYVLDLNIWEAYPHVEPLGGGLEAVVRLPPVLCGRVAEKMSNTVAIRRCCTRMHGSRGKRTFPVQDTGCAEGRCFPV